MRNLSLLAALVVALGASCTYRNEDVNRVVDPYWPKDYFTADDEWYLRSTVVDAPPEHGWISIADGDWLMLEKIRWEITQGDLIGWRTYSITPGSENEQLPGAEELYRGQPVAIFAITDHFDIRREFDPTSGEQANVISENRDRLWFDRAFMRVDWTNNKVPTFKFHLGISEPGYCGGPCIAAGGGVVTYQAAQSPAEPKRWRFEPDYFEVTTRHLVAPDIFGIIGYYGIAYSYDFAGAVIDVRHSFMKVPKSDYEPLPMPPTVVLEDADGNEVRDEKGFAVRVPINDRFGYFGSLGRTTFDANRGQVSSGQIFNASRFNLWKKNRHADGTPIPLDAREAKEGAITYYTNVEHPKQLLNGSRRVAANWNKVFRTTVWKINEAKYTGAADADGIPSDVPNVFVLKENDCNVANVKSVLAGLEDTHPELVEKITTAAARKTVGNGAVVPFNGTIDSVEERYNHANTEIDNLLPSGLGSAGESFDALQREELQALNDLERICSALEYYTTDDITMGVSAPDDVTAFHYQRLGDTRYSMMNLLVGDFQSGWLGLGPPYADPETGETISGTANVAIAMLDRYATRAVQYVQALNGETSRLDEVYGFDIKDFARRKMLENSRLVSKKASQQTANELDQRFEALERRGELLKEIPPTRANERLARAAGDELEQQLITSDDVALFGLVDPAAAASVGLDDTMLDAVSPLRNPALRELGRERERRAVRMGMRAADPPEMLDFMIIGNAIALRDMSYAERFKRLREDTYVAVMLHEVGHNTGLFHNFAGSTDAINYGSFFWEVQNLPVDIADARAVLAARPDEASAARVAALDKCQEAIDEEAALGAASDFESLQMTTQECLRQSEGMYSSIMDYHGNWNSDFNGLGPYDFAATKFAYGQLVEVFPEENLVGIDEPGEMKKNIFYNDWRNIPDMFTGDTPEERAAKMYERDHVKVEWNTSSTRSAPAANEVPYRFGYGAYPEPTVKVFDFGPDTRTNAAFQLNNYYQKYFFSHFARNRLWDFDAVNGAVGADMGVMDDFTEKMQWFFFYRATDPNFAGTYADEDFLATTVIGMNHMAHILAEPNSGDYHTMPNFQLFGLTNLRPDDRGLEPLNVALAWSNFGFCDAVALNDTDDFDVMCPGGQQRENAAGDAVCGTGANLQGPKPGFAGGNVPMGEGRPFFVGFTDDYVDFFIRYVGHYWTKQNAIVNLGWNYAYFPRVDADVDYRTFDVSWYRLFPREVGKIFHDLITQDDIALGGYLDTEGNYVRPDVVSLDGAQDTTGFTRVLPQIAINHNFYAYLVANAFLESPYDDQLDFTKTMQIAIDGATDDTRAYDDAEARDAAAGCVIGTSLDPDGNVSTPATPPACKTVLSFTHPATGLTFRGLKVGETPVAFDLIKRLNLLKERFARLNACNEDMSEDGTLDSGDAYCACISNIGYAREPAQEGGEFITTCTDNYEVILPGETITRPKSDRAGGAVEELTLTCTALDLRNRRDSAREALDEFTDYVNDLRTWNQRINTR